MHQNLYQISYSKPSKLLKIGKRDINWKWMYFLQNVLGIHWTNIAKRTSCIINTQDEKLMIYNTIKNIQRRSSIKHLTNKIRNISQIIISTLSTHRQKSKLTVEFIASRKVFNDFGMTFEISTRAILLKNNKPTKGRSTGVNNQNKQLNRISTI